MSKNVLLREGTMQTARKTKGRRQSRVHWCRDRGVQAVLGRLPDPEQSCGQQRRLCHLPSKPDLCCLRRDTYPFYSTLVTLLHSVSWPAPPIACPWWFSAVQRIPEALPRHPRDSCPPQGLWLQKPRDSFKSSNYVRTTTLPSADGFAHPQLSPAFLFPGDFLRVHLFIHLLIHSFTCLFLQKT